MSWIWTTKGTPRTYAWEVAPDLSALTLLGDDGTGGALRAAVEAKRRVTGAALPGTYGGPAYDALTAEQQAEAGRHVEAAIFDWSAQLATATEWDEDTRDHMGRGWERLATDAAFALMRLALCPWTGLDLDEAEATYHRMLPEVIAANGKCGGKWDASRIARAEAAPVDLPPWLDPVFDATPTLQHIRQAAHNRLVAPSGLLAVTLLRVLAEVPPSTVLPPVIGDVAALNLGAALVAGSGGGKSATVKLSRRLLGLVGEDQKHIEEGMGSGEGLIDLFLEPEMAPNANGVLRPTGQMVLKADPRVFLVTDEVEQMGAVGGDRNGSPGRSL